MGNCGTREESAVVSHAQVPQLHMLPTHGHTDKDKKHNRSISELSDPSSTPRNFEDSRKNALLYTHVIAFTLYELETITKSFRSDYILSKGGFDTVLKKVLGATKDATQGKLGPNWEGPYRITSWHRKGTYYLETLDGKKLSHPWNAEHLKKYYQ